eukprot:gb/GEZN01011312.1/.p1 GENE.gb/GEZN01011312.1/~~gb/GEZN01011312.1/.p1  ORF type:complete len:213 (-),score=1.03 gb/GEZN01011312.1/:43-681(-)
MRDHKPNHMYGQPPLTFYRNILEIEAKRGVSKAFLMSEDANHVLYNDIIGIKQPEIVPDISEDFVRQLEDFVCSRVLVFAHSTLRNILVDVLDTNVTKVVYFPDSRGLYFPRTHQKVDCAAGVEIYAPTEENLKNYTVYQHWSGSTEQRHMMKSYVFINTPIFRSLCHNSTNSTHPLRPAVPFYSRSLVLCLFACVCLCACVRSKRALEPQL